ncbi:MAG: hypothetical protein EOM28_11490 [Clostridia bacterium]|nr:hypothetical protein [Clostridia bacterium]
MKIRLTSFLLAGLLSFSLSGQAFAAEFTGGAFSGLLRTDDKLLATDVYNKVIWILSDDKQEIYAGKSGATDLSGEPKAGYYDSTFASSLFASPWAVAPYLDGYAVTDAENNVVRYLSKDSVFTLAGSTTAGLQNGLGTKAKFNFPTGLAADTQGNLYVADTGNNVIRKITKTGQVSTYAEGFCEPTGLCWHDGVLYVADSGYNRICKVVGGAVTVLSGGVDGQTASDGVYEGDYVNGAASKAKFSNPQGVAVSDDGTIYVADTGNSAVRTISNGQVSTFLAPAEGDSATFPVSPRGLVLDGNDIYVSDVFAQEIQVFPLKKQASSFADVTSQDWYAKAVAYASSESLLVGTNNGFEPEEVLSRAMAASLMSRLYNRVHPSLILTGNATFSDVPKNAWYYNAVSWAGEQNITGGTGTGFEPNRSVTREELASFLYRYALLTDMDISMNDDALSTYPDAGQVDAWAKEAMTWATSKGIFHGDQNGYLNPQGLVTRAQTAQILQNLSPILN